jgi:hypothetical protein
MHPVMQRSEWRVCGPTITASGVAFVTALSANLVKVVEEEYQKLLGARWQRVTSDGPLLAVC